MEPAVAVASPRQETQTLQRIPDIKNDAVFENGINAWKQNVYGPMDLLTNNDAINDQVRTNDTSTDQVRSNDVSNDQMGN